jgi:hypothetical protein
MIHNTAQLKVGPFTSVRCLEFTARSEAIESMKFILRSRKKMSLIRKEFIDQMVAMKFIKKERKLTDTAESILRIESSIELLETILSCETEFPEGFIQEAQAQIDSLKTRFASKWDPEFPELVNRALSHHRSGILERQQGQDGRTAPHEKERTKDRDRWKSGDIVRDTEMIDDAVVCKLQDKVFECRSVKCSKLTWANNE